MAANRAQEYARLFEAAVRAEEAAAAARSAAEQAEPRFEFWGGGGVGRGTRLATLSVGADGRLVLGTREMVLQALSEETRRAFLRWVVETFGTYGSLTERDLVEPMTPPSAVPF